jgi:hypothetical protein
MARNTVVLSMLSVVYAVCHKCAYYAECHYAECRYGECRGAVRCQMFGATLPVWHLVRDVTTCLCDILSVLY